MTKSVFISYRREDAAAYAGRLHDRLKDEFQVFMDVDNIPLGQDFRAVLGDAVGSCDVLIVCVGKSWANAADEDGNRRLEHQQDFVRFEIAEALERDIPVVPVLLDGVTMPHEGLLPDNIKPLAFRNGIEVRHGSFHGDTDKLIKGLRLTTGSALSVAGATDQNESRKTADVRGPVPEEVEDRRSPAYASTSRNFSPERKAPKARLGLVEHSLLLVIAFLTVGFALATSIGLGFASFSIATVSSIWLTATGGCYLLLFLLAKRGRSSR